MIVEIMYLAFFVSGFGFAVVAFYDDIKIGIQVRREAKKKLNENMGVPK